MSAPKTTTPGQDANGISTFIDNPAYQQFSPQAGIIYSTGSSDAIDLNHNADISAFESRDHVDLIPKQGSIVVVAEWPAGADGMVQMHRTLSVDVEVMIQGQIKSELDSGDHRLVSQGEVLIQRGTMHAWKNPSTTEPARMVCFVLPSQPVQGASEGTWQSMTGKR